MRKLLRPAELGSHPLLLQLQQLLRHGIAVTTTCPYLHPMAALVALPGPRSAASPIAPQSVCNQAAVPAPTVATSRKQQRLARRAPAAAASGATAAMSAQAAVALGSLEQLPDTYRGALLDQFGERRLGWEQRQ